MKARLLAALCASGTLLATSHSSAFCRATTCCRAEPCDPSQVACERDDAACLATGKPLFWASSCVQVYLQAGGLPTQGISFDAAKHSVTRAADTWLNADCGNAAPLLDLQVLGPIGCGTAEYNRTQKNANIVIFREDEWPYIGGEDALGFTHLTFDLNSGELWDADIEINAVAQEYSVGEPVRGADLDSVLTHEMGHFLGLDHTRVGEATMFASYVPGTDTLRTLAADDVQGMCAVYAPDRNPSRSSCTPRHGFSEVCGADQPANSATSEGTDQETAGGVDSTPTSKGCTLSAVPQANLHAPWFALGFALAAYGARRRCARHQFVSCERVARQR